MTAEQVILYMLLLVLGLATSVRPAPREKTVVRLRPGGLTTEPSLLARSVQSVQAVQAACSEAISESARSTMTSARRVGVAARSTMAAARSALAATRDAIMRFSTWGASKADKLRNQALASAATTMQAGAAVARTCDDTFAGSDPSQPTLAPCG